MGLYSLEKRKQMATDTSGNQKVDFVWGNFPMQPNDDRAATVTNTGGSTGDYGWAQTTKVASDRLNAALDNHANAEAGWAGYPNFVAAAGNYIITAVSGDGTTVTYTSQNKLAPGNVVNITGLSAGAYNLSGVTVVTADALKFTVTNSANAGLITGQYGKVQSTTALTAADGAGIGYINVPNVLGATTAVALDSLKDAGYEAANITTASAATNAAVVVTEAARSAGVATFQITTATAHGYVAGNKVTISGTDTTVNGTWTVGAVTSTTFEVLGTATTVLALTGLTGSVVAVAGTIKSQSTAAGTGSVATTATITITPWAVAS